MLECWYVLVLECDGVLLEFVGMCWCVGVLVPSVPWKNVGLEGGRIEKV